MTKKEGLAVLCCVLTACLGATSAKQGTPASPFHVHRTPEKTPKEIDSEAFLSEYTFPAKLVTHVDSAEDEFQDISSHEQQSQPDTDFQRQEDLFSPKALISNAISPLLTGDQKDTNLRTPGRVDKAEQTPSRQDAGVPGANNEDKHKHHTTPERTHDSPNIPFAKQQSQPGTDDRHQDLSPQNAIFADTLSPLLHKDHRDPNAGNLVQDDSDVQNEYDDSLSVDQQSPPDTNSQTGELASWQTALVEETLKHILGKENAEEMQEHILDNAEETLKHDLDEDENAGETLKRVFGKDNDAKEKPKYFWGTDDNAEEMLLQVLGTDDNSEETPRRVLDKNDDAEEMLLHVMGKYNNAEQTQRIPGTGKESNAEHSPEKIPAVILEEIGLDTFTPQHSHPYQAVRQSKTEIYDYMDTLSADRQNLPESNSNTRELLSWQSEVVKETVSQILSKNGNPEETARFPAAREGYKVKETAEQSVELTHKIIPEMAPGPKPAVAPELASEETAERSPDEIDLDVFSPDYALQEQPYPLDYDVVNIPSFDQTKAKPHQHSSSQTEVAADTELRFLGTRKGAKQKTRFKTPKKANADQMPRFHISRKNANPNYIPKHKPEELSPNGFPSDYTFPKTLQTKSGTAQYDYDHRPSADEQGQTNTSSQRHKQTLSHAALVSDKSSQVSGTAKSDQMLEVSQEQMNTEEFPPDYAFLEELLEKTKSVELGRKGFLPSDQQSQPDSRSPIHEYSSTQTEHAHDKNAQVSGTVEENAEQRSEHTLEKINPEKFPLGYTFPEMHLQQSKLYEHDHENTQQERQPETSSHEHENITTQTVVVTEKNVQVSETINNTQQERQPETSLHIHENESTQFEAVSKKNTHVPETINNTEQRSEHTTDEIDPQEFPLDYTFPEITLKQANTTEYEYENIPSADQQSQSDAGSSSLPRTSKHIAEDTDDKDGVSTTNANQSTEVITREIDPDDYDMDNKERVSKTNSEQSPEENTQTIDSKDNNTVKKDSVSKTNAEQSPEENTQEIDSKDNDTDKKDSVSKTNAEQSPEATLEEINPQDFPPDYTFPDNPDNHSAEYDEVDIPSTDPQSPDSRLHQHSSTQTELVTAGNNTVSWATNNTTSQHSPEASTKNASAELKPEEIESTTFHPTETFPKEPVTQSDSVDYEYEGIIPVHQKAQRGNKAQSHKHSPTKNSTASNNSTRDMRTHVNTTQKPDLPASKTNGTAQQKPEQAPLDPHNFPSNYTSPEKFTNRTAEYDFKDTPSAQNQSQNGTGSQIHELSKIQTELHTDKKAIVSEEDDKAELTHEETSEEFDPQSLPADYTFPEELIRPPSFEQEHESIQSSNDKGQTSVHSQSQQNSSTQAVNIASENGDNIERNLGSKVSGKANNTDNASPISAKGTAEKAGQNIQKDKENLPRRNQTAQPTMALSPESKDSVPSKGQPQEESVMVNQETPVTTQSPVSKPTLHNVDVLPESKDNVHSNPQRQPQEETMKVGQETLMTTKSPDSKPTPHNVDVLTESKGSEHSNPQRQPQEETVIVGQETLMTTHSPDSDPTPHNVEFSSDTKDKAFPHPEKQSEVAKEDSLVTTQSTDTVVHVPTGKPKDNDKDDDDALEVSDEDVLRMTKATDDNAEYDELDVEITTEYEGRLYRFRRAAMETTTSGETTTGMVACLLLFLLDKV